MNVLYHQLFSWQASNEPYQTTLDVKGKFKPPTETDDKTVDLVKELVDEDPQVTIRYIAESLGLSSGSVWHILRHKLGYRKVCARNSSFPVYQAPVKNGLPTGISKLGTL